MGEIATERLVVVLNKVDMLPAEQRDKLVIKAQKLLRKTFVHTKFRDPHMVAVSAKPGRHTMLDMALHRAVMLHEPHVTTSDLQVVARALPPRRLGWRLSLR